MKSTPLSFSPALPCVACRQLTTAGRIYTMNPLVWQLVPLCNEHTEEPETVSEVEEDQFDSISELQRRITNDLQTIRQLRRKRQRIARAFLGLRKQSGHTKAKRALRRKLRCICQRQAEEV